MSQRKRVTAASTFAQTEKETVVIIHTDKGDITVKLYNETPKHRDNFIKLIKSGWYNGSEFHRVISNFMIQGGGSAKGKTDPGYKIDAEFLPKLFHKKGALAAAREGDNVNPKRQSSGSQFYIVQGRKFNDQYLNMFEQKANIKFTEKQREVYKKVGGTPHLDGAYTVFGEVISGLNVVDTIAAVKTNKNMGDKPIEPVTMTMEILE
ncbi:MAG: peptidylprolyl isomerase [Thermodesulfobacteriota bacterium]|nr:peptidylprolyl isomerase [Thermodesulfobacteriota bacterium]